MPEKIFTSESVTEGHPDKVCDAVSDAVLDVIMANDPMGRVACETAATTGMVLVMGEITTDCFVDIAGTVRETVKKIGYDDPEMGFDCKTCAVLSCIDEQSPDIALGVDASLEYKQSGEDAFDLTGAGDQGMVFGFACKETDSLMPLPISLAHELTMRLAEVRKTGALPFVWPDGKSQVTVKYAPGGGAEFCPAVVVSTQHRGDVSLETLREAVMEEVIKKTVPPALITKDTKIHINPTGRFVVGGPHGDSGLTGRKIIVDSYGGFARHGGGAYSGKDPTKVDRSASYMARYVAKNLVAAGLADYLEVQIAYAIGVAQPVSISVNAFGTSKLADERLEALIAESFDLRPAAIIEFLNLRRPIYSATTAYGHFGRTGEEFTWERTDAVEKLLSKAGS